MERSLINKFILDLSRLKIGMVQVVASNLSKITIIGMQSTSKQRQSIFKRLKNLIQLSKCINKVNLTLQAFQVRQQSLTQIKRTKRLIQAQFQIGPMAANILTGSALIEQIFSIPGIGQQFVTSIPTKDYPVIMGTTIVYAVMLMVAILLTDIITSFVDPRVRLN